MLEIKKIEEKEEEEVGIDRERWTKREGRVKERMKKSKAETESGRK